MNEDVIGKLLACTPPGAKFRVRLPMIVPTGELGEKLKQLQGVSMYPSREVEVDVEALREKARRFLREFSGEAICA